jgi:uncharacterized protein (TIGR00369 family)
MTNPIVAQFQALIGQEMRQTPSGVGRWLRATLLEIEEGRVRVSLEVREEMTNPMGMLHGGTAALIIDELIGAAVFTLHREHFCTTTNLALDFLRPARLGDRITAEARIVRAGQTVVYAEGTVWAPDGQVAARGTSNLVRTHIPIPRP